MEKRILTLFFVVVAAITIGVVVVAQRMSNPIMIGKLDEIVSTLKGIEAGINKLDTRLTTLETNSSSVATFFKTIQQQQGQPQQARQMPPQEDLDKVHTIDVAHSQIKGNKDAPITIVEFVDFQCPFCQRFHPIVDEVMKTYPKDVRYILKNYPLPFHPQAKPAAKAALAANEQGKYWEMVEVLFQNAATLSEDKFKELAKQVGLNVNQFLKDYKEKDAQWEDIIAKDMALGSQVDVRGTPSYFINGKKTNARDPETFKAEVQRILEK